MQYWLPPPDAAPRWMPSRTALAALSVAWGCSAVPLSAQGPPIRPSEPETGGLGYHAIGLFTRARPGPGGEVLREAYLTQPLLLVHDPRRHVSSQLVLNFEAWTLQKGELNAGTWGEGYVDRRHPHTFLHEVVLTLHGAERRGPFSLTAGRGFVPFGSDDPMVRPFVKYPSNHHLAQVLERWILVGAARLGPFAIEAAAFNGDEPAGPRSLGERSRFGDSWAGRVTLWPSAGLELQASHARLESPENPAGGGLDHHKWHASVRFSAAPGGVPVYGLAEWGRTDEHGGRGRAFSFGSTLVEGAVDAGRLRLALRWEGTTRPEEERLEDPFRSPRPHSDDNVLGVTRWRGPTLHLGGARGRDAAFVPFLEVSRLRVREVTGALFDPVEFYGGDVHWTVSLGLRFAAGVRHERAGRYGVALPAAAHGAGGLHE